MTVRLITITFLLLSPLKGMTQDIKVTSGVGLPDLAHVGIGVSVSDRNEVGFQLGTFFIENTLLTPTLEHRLYFRKSRRYQSLNTWFFGQRITYYFEESDENKWKMVFLNLSIGRNMYFSKRFGISCDGGILFIPYDRQFSVSDGSGTPDDSSGNFPVFVNLRMQFFYRL